MAKRVTAYRAEDGTIFNSAKECDAYELNAARTASISKFLTEQGIADATISTLEGGDTLERFLIDHADLLVKALSVKPGAKRGPKAKRSSEEGKKTTVKRLPVVGVEEPVPATASDIAQVEEVVEPVDAGAELEEALAGLAD